MGITDAMGTVSRIQATLAQLNTGRAATAGSSSPTPAKASTSEAFAQVLAGAAAGAAGAAAATTVPGTATGTLPGAATGTATGQGIADAAHAYLGVPYAWGGTNPATGLDCSGLVQRVYKDLGIDVPRVASDQGDAGKTVPDLASAMPGDLLVTNGGQHIGIFIGNNQYIHAPAPGQDVRIETIPAGAVFDKISRIIPGAPANPADASSNPAEAFGGTLSTVPPVAIPSTAVPSTPATPAAAPRAAEAVPGTARTEAPVGRTVATDSAGDAAYSPGAPSSASAPAVVPASAPAPAPALASGVAPALVPGPVPTTAPASAPPPAPAVPVPSGFAAQLARPVFTLASGGTGEHTMTLAVDPENLGPVTVQAHISASGVRVELFAASADGREALRQILPDLKRDLAGAGLNASLDLSAGSQPGGGQDTREQIFHGRTATGYPGGTDTRQLPMNSQASRAAAGLYGTDGSLDVMA